MATFLQTVLVPSDQDMANTLDEAKAELAKRCAEVKKVGNRRASAAKTAQPR